jgi:hypothetical protein
MRMPDSDVIPCAFYEVLLLDDLAERINEKELVGAFDAICALSGLTMNFIHKSIKIKASPRFNRRLFW